MTVKRKSKKGREDADDEVEEEVEASEREELLFTQKDSIVKGKS